MTLIHLNTTMKYSVISLKVMLFLATTAFLMLNDALAANQQIAASDKAQILTMVDEIRAPGENFSFRLEVNSESASNSHSSELGVWVHQGSKSLVRYQQPIKQRNRALLLDGANMWIYIPGTRRPIRISPQQQLMGAVSYADVARVVFSEDYQVSRLIELSKKLENHELNSELFKIKNMRSSDSSLTLKPGIQLELTARYAKANYQKIHLWVTAKEFYPIRADFISLSGRQLRTIYYRDYRLILGKQRPTTLAILDAINPKNRATLKYSNFKLQKTPGVYFQPSYLAKSARLEF